MADVIRWERYRALSSTGRTEREKGERYMSPHGLSQKQVEERIAKGLQNTLPPSASKTNEMCIRDRDKGGPVDSGRTQR